MKLIKKNISKQIYILIGIVILLTISSCEGLDDWTELQNVDLFDLNKNESENEIFKRYNEPGMSSQPLVLFLKDDRNSQSKSYSKNIQKICDYTKLPFRSINISSWNASLKIAPSTRVISIYDTQKLNDASIAVLTNFVSNGGTLFLPYASEDRRMVYLLGFKPEAENATDTKSYGMIFKTPLLPNSKDKIYFQEIIHYGFAAANFSPKIKVLATAINNSSYPAILENSIGSGRVILYNTSSNFTKADRGFLFSGILRGLQGIPYPIANTSTIFLDDFPSPLYDIKAEPIASEMNLNISDFVKNVWWPDMIKLSKEYKIPYAAMTTFDYRNKIVPPFTLDQWNLRKVTINNKTEPIPDWLVRDVYKNGHEVAFHGYNHVSLLTELWKNKEFIGTSLNSVKKKWEISDYGVLPSTYVPPSNDIDKMGIVELKKAMPSLKYMCSLYIGELKLGGDREFDYDPYHKDFFDYPRISSGFYMKDETKYTQQSLYLFTGIWTHFVHPDDVFQIPSTANSSAGHFELRNNRNYGWHKTKGSDKAMLPEFKSYIKFMTNTFPQLRFMNGRDGAKAVIDWRASRYTHHSEDGLYTVKDINPDQSTKQYWFMYGSAVNADKIESRLKTQVVLYSKTPFMDGYLYSIYTNKPKLTILDLNFKFEKQKQLQSRINLSVKADLIKFNEAVKFFKSGGKWQDDSDKKLKLELVTLKSQIINNAAIDSVTWNKYAKYLSWEDKGEEVWKMLEEHVKKFPTKSNVMYSKELNRIIGYPNELVREKWVTAQLLVTPNDKDLLNSYVADFYTPENQEKIKTALKALLSVDTSAKNYKNYINHLLAYNPEEARVVLTDKKPTEELAEYATTIAWLFADKGDYQKALDWSELSTEIDFPIRANWLIELGQYKLLEEEYNKYIAKNPNEYKVKAMMSTIYFETSRFKEAWVLTNSLPEIEEKEALRKKLNNDVVDVDKKIQDDLIANESELFYPNILKTLLKSKRLEVGDFVDFKTSLETNKQKNSIQKNILSYNLYDKKTNIHSISATYSGYYIQPIDKIYESNVNNSLAGLQYKFTTSVREEKPQYWSSARLELDQSSKLYYQFGIGYTAAKNKNFRSSQLNLFPVETAPGLNENIYNLRLNHYEEFYLFKKINTTISVEGNYYTEGLLSIDTIVVKPIINPERFARNEFKAIDSETYSVTQFDDALDASLTLRMLWDDGEIKRSKFIPLIEGHMSQGTLRLPSGFPYWMIKNRIYGGGGLAWELVKTNLKTRVEAGHYFDSYSKNFQRFSGNLSYQIFDFTAVTLDFEIFNQSQFYSNSIQFGIKYNLNKKISRH